MIVLDTSVLVYAVGADHELAGPCRALVSEISEGGVRATTTVEVIQEFAHVSSRRRPRAEAVGLARDFATVLRPLVVVDGRDLDGGLRLFETSEQIGAFDAVLAVVTARSGAALVTADRALAEVADVAISPSDPDLIERARALN